MFAVVHPLKQSLHIMYASSDTQAGGPLLTPGCETNSISFIRKNKTKPHLQVACHPQETGNSASHAESFRFCFCVQCQQYFAKSFPSWF